MIIHFFRLTMAWFLQNKYARFYLRTVHCLKWFQNQQKLLLVNMRHLQLLALSFQRFLSVVRRLQIFKIERRKDKLNQKVKKLEEKNSDEGQTIGWNVKLDLFEPEEIDALKIVKKIGRGGQSEVFEGINKNDSSSSTSCSSSFKHLQRFLLEYEILLWITRKSWKLLASASGTKPTRCQFFLSFSIRIWTTAFQVWTTMRKSVRSLRCVKQWKPSTLLQKLLLNKEYILPKPFDPRIKDTVSAAVFKAALESGVARV